MKLPGPFLDPATTWTLSDSDVVIAARCGTDIYNRRKGRDRYNRIPTDKDLEMQINSVGAEIATGHVIGIQWRYSPFCDYDGDLGKGVQVRSTNNLNGNLLLHRDGDDGKDGKGDNPDHYFFLTVGSMPTYTVVGFILAADGFKVSERKELNHGRPCDVVHRRFLHPVSEWVQPK